MRPRDESLGFTRLDGFERIRIGDEVIDASVRGKLAQMASAMKV